jgi:sugar phosphate isomerase/epimerase
MTPGDKATEEATMSGVAISRRGFLGAAGGALAGAALARAGLAGAAGSGTATGVVTQDKLGIQLWTCIAAWEADGPTTLALVAEMGYSYVEYAIGYGSATESDTSSGRLGMGPRAFRKALDDNGLWCNGGHGTSAYPYDDDAWKRYVEDNLIIGSRGLGANTGFPTTKSECMRYVEAVYRAHDVARHMGFKGSQFNHLEAGAWNLLTDEPDTYAWEFMVRHLPRDVWNPELDTDHAYTPLGSIARVIHYIRKYPGRWSLFHMKDGLPNVFLPDGSWVQSPLAPAEFGTGVFGLPDPADPEGRPHAGFQDVLTAIRETQRWNKVLLIAESDQSMATCADYGELFYKGMNGLTFPYRPRRRFRS